MKQRLIFAAKAAISGLLIWWLIDRIDTAPLLEAVARVTAGPLALAFVAMLLAAGLLALRWNAVNRSLGVTLSGRRALRLTFIGLFFSQTLPSTIGGDLVRIWLVYRDGVAMSRAASSVVSDRLFALATLLVIVAVSLPISFAMIGDPAARWSLPALVAIGFSGFAVLLLMAGPLGTALERWATTRSLLTLARDMRRLCVPHRAMATVLILALVIHALAIVAIWLIGRSISAEISLLHSLVFVPPVVLISMIPISVAGWGIREGAMVVAFGFVGVPDANALAVSLIFGLMLVAVGVPGGLLWLSDRPSARDGLGLAGHGEKRDP